MKLKKQRQLDHTLSIRSQEERTNELVRNDTTLMAVYPKIKGEADNVVKDKAKKAHIRLT